MTNDIDFSSEYDEILIKLNPDSDEKKKRIKTSSEVYEDVKKELEWKPEQQKNLVRFAKTSEALSGIRLKQFTVISGPTGAGKTTLVVNFVLEMIKQNTGCFVASCELGANDFHKALYSADSNLPIPQTIQEWDNAANLSPTIVKSKNLVYSTHERRVNHLQLLGEILYCHKHFDCQFVVVDNLNFILNITDAKNALAEQDRVIQDFVSFCKMYDIHVVMICHPNKSKSDSDEVVDEFGIKGSSTIIQEATNVLLWNRMKEDEFLEYAARKGMAPSTPIEKATLLLERKRMRKLKFAKLRFNGELHGSEILFTKQAGSERLSEA